MYTMLETEYNIATTSSRQGKVREVSWRHDTITLYTTNLRIGKIGNLFLGFFFHDTLRGACAWIVVTHNGFFVCLSRGRVAVFIVPTGKGKDTSTISNLTRGSVCRGDGRWVRGRGDGQTFGRSVSIFSLLALCTILSSLISGDD